MSDEMLTPEELERSAYIAGDVEKAELHAQLFDQTELIERLEELENEVENLKGELLSKEEEISLLESDLQRSEDEIAELKQNGS